MPRNRQSMGCQRDKWSEGEEDPTVHRVGVGGRTYTVNTDVEFPPNGDLLSLRSLRLVGVIASPRNLSQL